jgi:hypothetical protein
MEEIARREYIHLRNVNHSKKKKNKAIIPLVIVMLLFIVAALKGSIFGMIFTGMIAIKKLYNIFKIIL